MASQSMKDALPVAKLPMEIWVYVISEIHLDTTTLGSISLVSSTLREVAQRELFATVKFQYQSSLSTPFHINVDWSGYERKVQGICSSSRLCSFIQDLQMIFCNTAPWELHHSKTTDPVFCKSLEEVINALPTMTMLHRLSYNAPFMFRNFHQATLNHPSVRKLVTTPQTNCETPCGVASIHRGERHALQELEIAEWLPLEAFQSLNCGSIGARRCALASNMLITHSLSLCKLRVPILLLHDAVSAVISLPEFPHLHSLSIMRMCTLMDLDHLYGAIAHSVTVFLLHVHETVQFLDWRPTVPFNPLEDLPPSCFPNLETLEGDGVEHLLLHGPRSLRRLRITIYKVGPKGPRNCLEALKACHSNSQAITTLFVQNFAHSMDYGPVVGGFGALRELSYLARIPIGSDIGSILQKPGATPRKVLISVLHRFLASCLPSLPHIQTLSVAVCGIKFRDPMPLEEVLHLARHLPNDSLERFNFRLDVYKPDTNEMEKNEFEKFMLRRVRDVTGNCQWIAPEGKVMTDDYIPCSVHMQDCKLNRDTGLAAYESWMTI